MTGYNLGKKFEEKVKNDWQKSFPDGDILRLYDTTSGYSAITFPSDYICYVYPNQFYIECKTVQGNTFNINKLTQYEKLLLHSCKKGIRSGVIIWFYDHQKIVYVPIKQIEKMKNDGKKSVNIKMLEEKMYKIYEIPGKIKRTFIDSDYTILMSLEEGD